MIDNGLFLRKEELFYNKRTKHYIGADGELVPYEMMISQHRVFSDGGAELCDFSKDLQYRLAYREAAEELFGDKHYSGKGYVPPKPSKAELLDASRRRARRKIFDYAICNDWEMFITLTLDGALIDRYDYGEVIKKLTNFLGNRVKRHGLKYLGVPEYHRNGALHFHFVVSGGDFELVDSGTVTVEGRKRPIKRSYAARLGFAPEDMHTVYNIADWKLGFSTAIKTYGERGCLAAYISKELCKDVQKSVCKNGAIDKIGGRWYYHGGQLKTPICSYSNVDYTQYTGESYTVDTDGGSFKVFKFDENGTVLK